MFLFKSNKQWNAVFYCVIAFLWGYPNIVAAQQPATHEVGAHIGSMTYMGDLNPDFGFKGTRPMIGAMYRYRFSPYVLLKGTANLGWVAGNDAWSNNPYQKARNLSFSSHIFELSGQVELHFHRFEPGGRNPRYFFTPYLTTGLALFHFSPKAKYEGEWYNLRAIGTEGQNSDIIDKKPYKQVQLAIPIGLGVKYWLFSRWTLNAELTYRQALTDYLDDVSGVYVDSYLLGDGTINAALADRSGETGIEPIGDPGQQRGDKVRKDGYLMFNVGITYTFKGSTCPKSK